MTLLGGVTKPTLFSWALGGLADAGGWLAAPAWSLRASSSASPSSMWGARGPTDVCGGIGRLWWDGRVQEIARVLQHLSSVSQEIPGRAFKLCVLW